MNSGKKYLLYLALVLLGGTVVGVWHFHVASGQHCFDYVNPQEACDDSSTQGAKITPLQTIVKNKINDLIGEKNADNISAYYLSLSNDDNEWFSINNGKLYYPASLSKVPVMMWFYSQAESDPSIMNEQVNYVKGYSSAEQHFNYGGITPGNTYTVPELLKSMVVNSDNNAALALAQIMGPDQLNRMFLELGLQLPHGTSTSFRIDAKTAASFMRMLYDASYLTPADSEKALELLTQSKFTNGLVAGLPSGMKVAHKFGEWSYGNEKQLHDCGIVYMPGHPYLLCLMTEGSNFDTLAQDIADISKSVYTELDNR